VTYARFINIGDTPITSIWGSLYDGTGSIIATTIITSVILVAIQHR